MDTNGLRRDPEGARRRILDSAAEHFSRHGPDGARVDAIAAAARVNKRMLYHYFGDKQALFRAVLDDRAARPGGTGNTSGWDTTTARLLVWAAGLDPVGATPGNLEQWTALARHLGDEQDRGRLRNDIRAGTAAMLYLALAALPALLPAHVRAILGSNDAAMLQGDLRKLLNPPAELHGGRGRPRVRMQPQVRPR